MNLTLLADPDGCGQDEPCPKIWRSEDGRYWLQGNRATSALLDEIAVPDHEAIVEIDPRLMGWTPDGHPE